MRPLAEITEGDAVTIAEWKALVGSPARLSLSDHRSHDGTVKIPGTIRDATLVGINMELFFPLVTPRVGSSAVLEVMSPAALLQCHTTILNSTTPQSLHLAFPTEVHRIDRRQSPRARVSVSATVVTRPGNPSLTASIQNISVGGCAAVLPASLEIGQVVQLDLQATGLSPARLEAQVVRCSLSAAVHGNWEIGFSFYNMTEHQRKHLESYVKVYA